MYITAIIKAASRKKGGWLLIIRSNNSYGVNAPIESVGVQPNGAIDTASKCVVASPLKRYANPIITLFRESIAEYAQRKAVQINLLRTA